MMPLSQLQPGESGRLVADTRPSARLASLGFVAGTEVRVVRRAPLGDPVELELRGYRVCLRADQVDELTVDRCEP